MPNERLTYHPEPPGCGLIFSLNFTFKDKIISPNSHRAGGEFLSWSSDQTFWVGLRLRPAVQQVSSSRLAMRKAHWLNLSGLFLSPPSYGRFTPLFGHVPGNLPGLQPEFTRGRLILFIQGDSKSFFFRQLWHYCWGDRDRRAQALSSVARTRECGKVPPRNESDRRDGGRDSTQWERHLLRS